ncbi:MAG: hypothetical protein ACXW32_13320 [Limisphaerales bacterium]
MRIAMPVAEGAHLRLEWSGGSGPFQLQDAPSPDGPWLNAGIAITGTNTQVDLPLTRRFFRVGGVSTGGGSGEEELMATLRAVETFVSGVTTTNPPAWRTEVLNFLNGRADINSAGETTDGVWAITTDGIPLALWNNRSPDPFDPEDVMPQAAAFGTQTPGNTGARFATTVGAGFRLAGPRLSRQLSTHGYAPSFDSAPLDSLKGQRNESVFFFNTHGGAFHIPRYGADGNLVPGTNGTFLSDLTYGLWSGTKVDANSTVPGYNHAEFVAEVQAKRLCLSLATVSSSTNSLGVRIDANEWHFGITAEWVRHYMTFPRENHASIWLGACLSGSPGAAAMRSAFRAAGAEMVSGWTDNVNGDSVLAATSFLYDRLLGANQVQPPATPQRAFGYEDCWTELRSKGLHRHPSLNSAGQLTTTEIIYEGAAGDEAFGVFAPSVAYVLIDETSDRAHLVGIFGTPPESARRVVIGGADATVISWEPRKIVCSLPRTGDGSAGDVQVIVHGLKSNIRRITRWTVNGTYKMTEADTPHVVDGTLKMIFRADVGEYRKTPGNIFIRPTRYAVAAQSSEVRLEAKGVVSEPCGEGGGSETSTWLGSALFPTYDPTGPQITHAVVSLNTIDQAGALGLAFGMRDPDSFPLKMRLVLCEGGTFTFPLGLAPSGPVELDPLLFGSPLEELLPDGTKYEYPLPGGVFAFGSDWAIPAGSADSEIDSGMKWNRAEAEFPPDPDAAR